MDAYGTAKRIAVSTRSFFSRHVRSLRAIERLLFWSVAIVGVVAVAGIVSIIGRPSETSGIQPSFSGGEQQQKRLVIFLDGTWNSVDSNTNVWRMRALCASTGDDGKPQLMYYGIGVNGVLGGTLGQGLDENIRLAYEWLVENYNEGDEIFIFGFSRGAYTARSLAGLITIDGILKPGAPIGVGELFDGYKANQLNIWKLQEMEQKGSTGNFTLQEKWLVKYSTPAKIKMVGVWDTVGSVGWKGGNIRGFSRSQFDYLQTGLRIHILNAYQALAIDEHRIDFAPTLWDKKIPVDVSQRKHVAAPRPISSVEQRWFVGAHANVGGGYKTDLLAQAPLRWMMAKAHSQGLSFRSDVDLDGDDVSAPIADSYKEFGHGVYSWLSKPFYRVIGRGPQVIDNGSRLDVSVNETIDSSVFARWRADSAYRPTNLVEWASRKHVDPAEFTTSVLAIDPRVAVP